MLTIGLIVLAIWSLLIEEVGAEKKYLFKGMKEDASPVQEYVGPEGADRTNKDNNHKNNLVLPDFLLHPDGNRIVLMYAPWCPHCKRFAPHFVEFAKSNITNKVDIQFHAISCVPYKDICRSRGVSRYPTIELIPDGKVNGTQISSSDLHPFFVLKEFGVIADEFLKNGEQGYRSAHALMGSSANEHIADMITTDVYSKYPRTKDDLYEDAYRSFDFAMRQSIFMTNGPLDEKTSDGFMDWIDLLRYTTPQGWKMQKPIMSLQDDMDSVVESEDRLVEIMDKFPSAQSWSNACRKGDDAMGYTCGLWELFHIVTVGAVEWNKASLTKKQRYRVTDVAETLRNYIEHFFSCEECRSNFLAEYDTCAHDRCNRLTESRTNNEDWVQLPLWLWETHNGVNLRLMKERAQREGRVVTEQDEIESQWPSRHACRSCWRPDGTWDEEIMWKFLRIEYWPDDETTKEYREALKKSDRVLMNGAATNDDDPMHAEDPSENFRIVVIVCVLLVLISAIYYYKRMKLWKTGKHKKYDLVA